jgi:antitoxin HicB
MISTKYPVIIRPLSKDEGGGFLAEYPDLPGCMADGETIEEALSEGKDAVKAWIATAKAEGMEVPDPNRFSKYSGQFRTRLPKSLHADLAKRAQLEGVSLNTMAITLIAAGLAKKPAKTKTKSNE